MAAYRGQHCNVTCTSVPSWLLMRTHSWPVHRASSFTRLVFPPAVGPYSISRDCQQVHSMNIQTSIQMDRPQLHGMGEAARQ